MTTLNTVDASDANISGPPTLQPEPKSTINYDAAVAEGKLIAGRMDCDWMLLAKLADQVETEYGEKTLVKFAEEIGVPDCTLTRRLSTFRKWDPKKAPAPKLYSVAQELQAHPMRHELILANPNMTKADARAHRKKLEGANTAATTTQESASANPTKPTTPVADMRDNNNERWFREVVTHANDVTRVAKVFIEDAEFVDGEVRPEDTAALKQRIEPKLLERLTETAKEARKAAEYAVKVRDFLQAILNEQPCEQLLLEAAE